MAIRSKPPMKRHAFRFKIKVSGKIHTCWAKVRPAKRDVFLPLKPEHVREAIKQHGVGNTQTCSMAVCAQKNQECFPHAVEGTIDWFYQRAFIVSRANKDGMPSECYVYAHSDQIGRLNDTNGGQKKLLAELEAVGERVIHLRPVIRKKSQRGANRPEGRRDGSRTKVGHLQQRGAKLRFAIAQMGAVPK